MKETDPISKSAEDGATPAPEVQAQYEAYPYPERDPADEAMRLVVGAPSHPVEIDHFLFEGRRDWTKPFRALVAGGGTGDGLIMLAQLLADQGTPAEIHYLDLSTASRRIAEARAAARGLSSITFHTGDLLTAPDLAKAVGAFDYIDCCGVLHHLPEPQIGFDALAAALAPEGGLGAMVYAPYGRAGVYEMQSALRALVAEGPNAAPLDDQPDLARRVLEAAPPTAGLNRNPFVVDHREGGDAGLYDLLLHSQDTPFDVPRLLSTLDRAGLRVAGFVEPARYDPASYLRDKDLRERAAVLPEAEQWAFAERFAGNLKAHVFYAAPAARGQTVATPTRPEATPILHNVDRQALAQTVAKKGLLRYTVDGLTLERRIDKSAAGLLSKIDGRTTLGQLQATTRLDWLRFSAAFAKLYAPLDGFNLLRFSTYRR